MKHIVLLESDINTGSMSVPLHSLKLSNFKIDYSDWHRADDIIFLTDDNILYSLKYKYGQYSISEEAKNFQWYCDRKQTPKLITRTRSNFLAELLRLHHDNVINLTIHEFHLIVLALFRRWYPNINPTVIHLNKLRTKYKSYLNENKSKGNIGQTYV
jgi:hypothetical protein